jgi:hypothetical protein
MEVSYRNEGLTATHSGKEPLDPLNWKLGGPIAGLQHYEKR